MFQLSSHSRLGVNSNFSKPCQKCDCYNSSLDVSCCVSAAVKFFLPMFICNKKLNFQLKNCLWKVLRSHSVRNLTTFLIVFLFSFLNPQFCLKKRQTMTIEEPSIPILFCSLGAVTMTCASLWLISPFLGLSWILSGVFSVFLLCFAKRGLGILKYFQ